MAKVPGHRELSAIMRKRVRGAVRNRKSARGGAPVKSRLGWVIVALGLLSTLGGLYLLGGAVNGVAYLSGAGQEVTVHVIESSEYEFDDEDYSLDMEEVARGKGYYNLDGERHHVRVSEVEFGEIIDARLPFITFGYGGVYQSAGSAVMQFLLGLVAVPVLSILGYLLILFGWSVVRGTGPPKLPLANSRRRLKS